MLSTLLGVVLAFITVMLLLSLVVMGLVQFTQSALRLRARNLIVGLGAFLRSEGLDQDGGVPSTSKLRLRRATAARHAAEILNETTPAKLRAVADANSAMNVMRGPATSWVDPDDLARTILRRQSGRAASPVLSLPPSVSSNLPGLADQDPLKAQERELAARFRALEPAMKDRFSRHMQIFTCIWAVVVAVVFQVSTPTLLTVLSASEAKREAIIAMVPGVLNQAETAIPAAMGADFVDRALAQLTAAFPNQAELPDLFAQVSGDTDSRDEMLAELRAVLTGVPNRDEIVSRYGQIIDTTSMHDVRAALTTAGTAIDSLEMIDIRPWGRGIEFYATLSNVFGVLITALLLSFGAPFWFEQLKNVASLRDALSTKGRQPNTA